MHVSFDITWHGVSIVVLIIGVLGLIRGTWESKRAAKISHGTSGPLGLFIMTWVIFLPISIVGLILTCLT